MERTAWVLTVRVLPEPGAVGRGCRCRSHNICVLAQQTGVLCGVHWCCASVRNCVCGAKGTPHSVRASFLGPVRSVGPEPEGSSAHARDDDRPGRRACPGRSSSVEPRGLEPLTPCLQSRCATNCAMAPGGWVSAPCRWPRPTGPARPARPAACATRRSRRRRDPGPRGASSPLQGSAHDLRPPPAAASAARAPATTVAATATTTSRTRPVPNPTAASRPTTAAESPSTRSVTASDHCWMLSACRSDRAVALGQGVGAQQGHGTTPASGCGTDHDRRSRVRGREEGWA